MIRVINEYTCNRCGKKVEQVDTELKQKPFTWHTLSWDDRGAQRNGEFIICRDCWFKFDNFISNKPSITETEGQDGKDNNTR